MVLGMLLLAAGLARAETPPAFERLLIMAGGEAPAVATPRGRAVPAAERSFPVRADDGWTLQGKILTPAGAGPSTPAVVILHGSGPMDMDGAALGEDGDVTTDNYKRVAEAFARAGFVALRYHKRGIARWDKKHQDFSPGFDKLPMSRFADDAAAAVRRLREGAPGRPVILVAHSEGTRLAPMVAERVAVDGLVLLGAMGRGFEDILRYQTVDADVERMRERFDTDHDGSIDRREAAAWKRLEQLLDETAPGAERVSIDALRAHLEAQSERVIRESVAPERRADFARLEPNLVALPRFRGPILILQGDGDRNTPPQEARLLESALRDSAHPDATVRLFPGLGHFLSPLHDGFRDTSGPFDGSALSFAADWAARRFPPR